LHLKSIPAASTNIKGPPKGWAFFLASAQT
jgi:hypothetical protein